MTALKTVTEIQQEIERLHKAKDLDETGLVVRLLTLIALEWTLGACPIAPSTRLKEVNGEILEGVIDEP